MPLLSQCSLSRRSNLWICRCHLCSYRGFKLVMTLSSQYSAMLWRGKKEGLRILRLVFGFRRLLQFVSVSGCVSGVWGIWAVKWNHAVHLFPSLWLSICLFLGDVNSWVSSYGVSLPFSRHPCWTVFWPCQKWWTLPLPESDRTARLNLCGALARSPIIVCVKQWIIILFHVSVRKNSLQLLYNLISAHCASNILWVPQYVWFFHSCSLDYIQCIC